MFIKNLRLTTSVIIGAIMLSVIIYSINKPETATNTDATVSDATVSDATAIDATPQDATPADATAQDAEILHGLHTVPLSETEPLHGLHTVTTTAVHETVHKQETTTRKAETAQTQPAATTTTQPETATAQATGEDAVSEKETQPVTTTEKQYVYYYSKQDAIDIAKVLWAECGGVPSRTEQACVAWCVLNRVDNENSSIYRVVRIPNAYAFREGTRVDDGMLNLAYDVLERWNRERNGETNVGRVLPKEYMYFYGDGVHNYFRDRFSGAHNTWNYSLPSPYST